MKSQEYSSIKKQLIPFALFPMVTGFFSGVVIFLFKLATSFVIRSSERVYAFVRENPIYLPLLILGAAVIGALSSYILIVAKECRGGGIPTAIASIRGIIPLKWIQGIFVLFGSALLTFFVGVPLGNEGPSVQMGTATGKGSARISRDKRLAWERYLMTGGASSGFAIATGAPLTGIIFALEEAHRRFSTTLFIVAASSVLWGTVTHRYLSYFFNVDTTFFDLTITQVLPMRYLWAAIIIGAIAGLCSLWFSRLYRTIGDFSKTKFGNLPFDLQLVITFAIVAFLGFLSANFVGTGHSLIETILHRKTIWYAVVVIFVVRAVLMIYSTSEGVTGGIFVPNLAFGAMIASLTADGLIALNLVDGEYYTILIVVGMASFFAAASRTPLCAIIFAAEALCVASNIMPVVFGVVVSYVIVEVSGKISFTDAVIETRSEAVHEGKNAVIVNTFFTVQDGAFVDGMEIRDILWPPTCTVLSIDRNLSKVHHQSDHELRQGDVVHLHYQTYDPDETFKAISALLGEQGEDERTRTHLGSADHIVPFD